MRIRRLLEFGVESNSSKSQRIPSASWKAHGCKIGDMAAKLRGAYDKAFSDDVTLTVPGGQKRHRPRKAQEDWLRTQDWGESS